MQCESENMEEEVSVLADMLSEPASAGEATVPCQSDPIYGQGAMSKSVRLTRDEVERLVIDYLDDLVAIDGLWVLCRSTGSWEIRWRPYAVSRIKSFIDAGMIAQERVDELSGKAYEPLNQKVVERNERIKQIAAEAGGVYEVGGVYDDGRGMLDDIGFKCGYEDGMHADRFHLVAERGDMSAETFCGSVSEAATWVKNLADGTVPMKNRHRPIADAND